MSLKSSKKAPPHSAELIAMDKTARPTRAVAAVERKSTTAISTNAAPENSAGDMLPPSPKLPPHVEKAVNLAWVTGRRNATRSSSPRRAVEAHRNREGMFLDGEGSGAWDLVSWANRLLGSSGVDAQADKDGEAAVSRTLPLSR